MSALIEFEQVCKYYQMGDTLVKAADHITMKIEKGEFVAIVGQSGSGTSFRDGRSSRNGPKIRISAGSTCGRKA